MPDTAKQGKTCKVELVMNKLKKTCATGLFFLMGGLILLLGANILLRYCFDSPIAWSNTISRYIYIIIVLVGSAIAYIEEGHARVDVLYNRVGSTVKKLFDFSHYIIIMGLCIIFMVVGTQHAISMWSVHPPIISWLPIGSIYLSIPLFAFLTFLYLLKSMISLFSTRSTS
jgi:TRAP-type C4-dicarboxylate transport system permease small subunit